MIFTKQQSDLQHSINKMALPVFVVDQDDVGEFRVVALNRAHTKATGLQLQSVFGKTPQMILPNKVDADFLVSQYQSCLRRRKPIAYSTSLTYQDTIKDIQTILHPISLDGDAPTRLVGQVSITATVPKETVMGALGDQSVLGHSDVRAIEAIIDGIRGHQTICSKDLMLLSVLMKNRSLSLSEVARLVAKFDHAQRGRQTAIAEVGKAHLADLPQSASA